MGLVEVVIDGVVYVLEKLGIYDREPDIPAPIRVSIPESEEKPSKKKKPKKTVSTDEESSGEEYRAVIRDMRQQHEKERKEHEKERKEHEKERKEHEEERKEHEKERKEHEKECKQLTEEINEYKKADYLKIMELKKDDSLRSLLDEMKKNNHFFEYESEAEKLRAEARDKLGVDSVNNYNFAITGEAGVGKSTLINGICGYGVNDPGAAKVGITECTNEVKGYPHPKLKHLVLYDLPGAGTENHSVETYFCDKRLYVFDCLLLVMSGRIRQNDLALAKFAQEMGTPVVFIRNKAKNDFETIQEQNENMKEEELIKLTISTIKQNIYNELMKVEIKDPNIFVIEARSLRQIQNTKFEEKDLLEHLKVFARARQRKT